MTVLWLTTKTQFLLGGADIEKFAESVACLRTFYAPRLPRAGLFLFSFLFLFLVIFEFVFAEF